MPAEGVGGESGLHRLHRHCYDPEYARMEAWLDEHPDFVQDYFLRLVRTLLKTVFVFRIKTKIIEIPIFKKKCIISSL